VDTATVTPAPVEGVVVGVRDDDPACPLSDCVIHPAANKVATSITETRAITLVYIFICFPQEHFSQVQIKGNARICSRLHQNLSQIPKKRLFQADPDKDGQGDRSAEVRDNLEEAGIEISRIRYLASEPWPFPNSLMMGFVADYAGGTLRPDGIETVAAGWFDRDNFPDFPLKASITRALIDGWISGKIPE
jgi:hypothetical protein